VLPAAAQAPGEGAGEPVPLPPEVRLLASEGAPPPASVPPYLDINDLSAATWGGAVSAAKEAMRLVAGPMSPEEEAAFDETWKPLFRFPHEKLVEWLNALNPLLGQYLATRASAGEAILGFDATQLEAAAAAAAGDAAAVEEAMQSAALQERLVASLVAGSRRRSARSRRSAGRPTPTRSSGGGRSATRTPSGSSTTSPSRGSGSRRPAR